MRRDELLEMVSEEGDGSSDFHDGYNGWLSWRIEGNKLTINFEDADHTKHEASWNLEPYEVYR